MADVGGDAPPHKSGPMTPIFRLLPLASTVLIASASGAQAPTTVPGWTVTTNITTDSGDGRRSAVALRKQVTARNLRLEFVQMSGFAGAQSIEGTYTILDTVDSTMTSVMPAQHMATVMGLGFLDPSKTGFALGEQHLTRSNLEDLGDGEVILGHATHHYRLTTAGTGDVTMMGQTCRTRLDAVSEMWIAPDVDFGPELEASMKHLGTNAFPQAAA